jgi:hypothetical protein
MKQQILILVAITVVLTNCRKKDHQLSTAGNNHFQNSGLTHFTPARLFTRDGEVLKPGLANAYQNEFTLYFYKPGESVTDPFYKEINFINDDSIHYVNPNRVFEAKRTVTDTYDRFSTPYFDLANDTGSLEFYIAQYKTFRRKETSGNSNNPNSIVYYDVDNPVYFLKKVKDTFFMPIIKYAIISRTPGIVTFTSNKFNNVFSADGVSHLNVKDTLLVQSFDIMFVKTLK